MPRVLAKDYIGLRYCVQRIELKSTNNVKDNVGGKFLIDGEVVHKLPPIKRGQPLVWDLPLFCNAAPNSIFRLKVHEESYRGLRRTSEYSFEFPVSDITAKSSTQTVERTSDTLSALISISNSEVMLTEAVAAVRNIKSRQALLDRLGASRAAFKTILDFGTAISEINPFAKVALAVLQTAWQKLEAQSKCDENIEQLLIGFADILKSVRPVKELARSEDLKRTISSILELIQDASMFIIDYKSENQAERMASAFASSSQDKVQEFLNQLKRLKENFDRELSVQEYLDRMNEELNKLQSIAHSTHHHRRSCLAGTRSTLINDIDEWIQGDTNNDNLLWVHGLAGLGKSSIAASVCQLLEDRNVLGASFFCKRDDKDLREPQRAMSTIIYRLARHNAGYGKLVVSAISNDPELCGRPIRLQYDSLVKTPLAKLTESGATPTSTAIVVVDALDECGTTESRREVLSCLFDMSRLVPWLKVIVTSRPDQDVKAFFDKAPAAHLKRVNVHDYDASDDIYTFLQERMSPQSSDDIEFEDKIICLLTDRAAGLFIWAETACRFILDGFDPRGRLNDVLKNSSTGDATAQLDLLYSIALRNSMGSTSGDNLKILRDCVGFIVATGSRTPLSVSNLEKLLGHGASEHIRPKVLIKVVKALGSVLYEDSQGAVRVYHPSFADYITTPSRSNDLCIDLMEHNAVLSTCCLNTMLKELKFNICGLETSYRLNKDVPELDSRVNSTIGPHLSYSCQYWISHITDADPNRVEIRLLRECLFSRILFYWIETLSLLKKLDVAISALPALMRWKQSPDDCLKCANDAYRFILSFYDAISESTPHLYLSALPFAPTESELAQRGIKWFPNTLKLRVGAEQHWTACLRTIAHPDRVGCLGVSPDGRRIVSGSGSFFYFELCADNALRIWDAETGTQVCEPLVGHSENVCAVAFSPDGRHIASSSYDKTVRIWDAQTGASIYEPFTKHSDTVKYVAFSGDGRRVVSGCSDTIRIWDAQTGAEVSEPLIDHSSGYQGCIALSPDDQHIFSISHDKMMTIWDATNGAQVSKAPICFDHYASAIILFSPNYLRVIVSMRSKPPQIGDFHTGSKVFTWWNNIPSLGWLQCTCMAFTPDGRRIALGWDDGTIQIWDPENRVASMSFTAHSAEVLSIAFSPDGQRIISGSRDKTVRIWDYESAAESLEPRTRTRKSPSGLVYSVAFSPDGRRIVSLSDARGFCRLDIWDAETGVNISPSPLNDLKVFHSVGPVEFSPDGQYIISRSFDETLQTWDVETGAEVSEPSARDSCSPLPKGLRFSSRIGRIVSGSNDNLKLVESVYDRDDPYCVVIHAFSPDGRRIVSGSKDNMMQIWDAETGAAVSKPFAGHDQSGGAYMYCVACSPDGRRIVSGSYDGTVRIWDVETAAEVHEPLRDPSLFVKSVALSPDGQRIVPGGASDRLQVWNLDSSPASELPTNLAYLLRHMDSRGWVSLENQLFLLWIPDGYRKANLGDSALCISTRAYEHSGVIFDFSQFVHGTSWTEVAVT